MKTNPSPTETKEQEKKEPVSTDAAKEPEKKEPTKLEGAPEKYESFKVPEGYELDAAVATDAQDLFKELNLSQDAAQKLVDFYSKQSLSITDKLQDLVTETRNGWRDQIAKDKTIGNGTDNLKDEVKATIGRAIEGLGDAKIVADFKEAMDLTGAGDHPAFVRAFYKLAQQVTEGKPVAGAGPSPTGQPKSARSAASAMYPNLPSALG